MSLPRYAEYKDSGVMWLGKVPAHWDTWKLRHAFGSIGSGTTPPSDEPHWYDAGTIPWITTGELREAVIYETTKSVTSAALQKFSTLKLHPKGALAIAMYGATIGRLGLLGVDAVTNQACCVLSSPRSLNISFVFYWLLGFKQRIIDLYATGGGQPNINQETISSLRIPAPNLSEQTAIAAFLDRETAKIDALIAEQEKLIALLAEKRQATISHAVTRGLNPDAPMKDSGVAWLGEVPAHWEAGCLKRFAEVIDCKHHTVEFLDDGLPIASIRELRNNRIDLTDAKRTSPREWEFLREGRVPEAGDLVFCRNASVGAVGYVYETTPRFCMGQDVCLIRPTTKSKFMHYQLIAPGTTNQIEAFLVGATIRRANVEEIRNLIVAWPPESEQTLIAAFLDTETEKLDTLWSEAERAVQLLGERRSALIAAAVTGQIDVRGAVAQRESA